MTDLFSGCFAPVNMEDFPASSRFQARRRLGAGAFGIVYEAFDRERQLPVALKTLRSSASDGLYLFKREFRALADLNHRNLVTLYELFADGPQWFFTMELLHGRSFIDYARGMARGSASTARNAGHPSLATTVMSPMTGPMHPGTPTSDPPASKNPRESLDYERLRETLLQLAEGLIVLHGAGKLHRDVKPHNVIVTLDGRVVLLDFGLVTNVKGHGADPTASLRWAGTPAYMAPEQAAGESVSPASDCSSARSMLYEALTFRLPFSGSTWEVISNKQRLDPSPVEEWDPHVPADLSALCLDLLARDPARRPGGRDVVTRLGGAGNPRLAASRLTGHAALTSVFVGRDRELGSISDAYETMTGGHAVAAYVHGISGIGKTTVIQHFLQQLRRRAPGTIILTGRCYQQESVPYKGLDLVIDALSQWFKSLPIQTVEALLPRDVLALARLFPVLNRVEAVALAKRRTLTPPDAHELRRRAVAAFRELLARLAEQWPLVLFVDDLQWSDLDSTHLLGELLRPPDPPRLLFIGAYRSDEADTSPALRALLNLHRTGELSVDTRELALRELELPEVRALVAALTGPDEHALAALTDLVHRESGGNPFFVQELARLSLSLRHEVTAGEVNLEAAISARISTVAAPAARLLKVLALAARPLAPLVALRAADVAAGDYGLLASMRVAQLIRGRHTDRAEEIELYHDRIREVVSKRIRPDEALELHRRLALVLEATGDADPEMVALHFTQAGHLDRAAEHAVVAADRAAAALAFDRAGRLYEMALRLQPDGAEVAPLRLKLADALANAGRGGDAGRAYLAAASDADAARFMELQRRAAEQFLISGHLEDGLKALGGVLRAVGMRLARTPHSAVFVLLLRRSLIRLRGLKFRERDSSELLPGQLLKIDSCWSVAVGLAFVDSMRAAEFQARHCLLALRSGEPHRIARALALEAGYSSLGGTRTRRRTAAVVRASLSLAERLGKPYAIGLASLTAGIAAHMEGRWQASLELCERADIVLRESCTGVTWELDTARLHIVSNTFFLGELKALCERAPAVLKSAGDRGDLYGSTAIILRTAFMAALVRDEPQRAREELARAEAVWSGRREFLMQHYWSMLARLDILAYEGHGPAAYDVINAGWRPLSASQMLRVQFSRVEASYRRARSAVLSALDVSQGASRGALLQQAERDSRTLTREGVDWAVGLGHLVHAGALIANGDADRAVAALSLAEEKFETAGMSLHLALSRRARGSVIGGDQGRTLVVAGDEWLRAHGVVKPDAFSRMITGWH